jgi:ELWxxDGT repeat protein
MKSSWLRSRWLMGGDGRNGSPASRLRPSRFAPRLEVLETRLLPSTLPQLLSDINPTIGGPGVSALTSVGSTAYFRGYDPAHGYELWRSDGTAVGTMMVADINPGPASSYIFGGVNLNGTLFFNADDGVHGTQIWRTNGTAR